MKKLFFAFLIFLLNICYSQTVEEIIKKHLEVTGGTHHWKELNSIIIKGDIILGLNESYPIEIYQQRPNLNKTCIEIQGKKIILNAYNGKKAIQYNFQTNSLEENNNYVPEAFESDLIDYSAKGFLPIFLGEERIDNKNCYKIKLTNNRESEIYYFDKTGYQLVREDNSNESKLYSDFKLASGLIFPYRLVVKNKEDDSEFILVFKSLEINKIIPEKEFKF